MKPWFALALLVVLLAACSTATPDVAGDIEAQAYVPLGGALDSSLLEDAVNTSVVVNEFDQAIVAWQESSPFNAYNNNVKQWNGSAWVSLGSTDRELINSAGQPSLAYSNRDRRVYAAFNEYDYFDASGNPNTNSVFHNIYVSFWNGSSWGGLGGALDRQVSRNTTSPSLALNPADNFHPVVAWQECATVVVPWDACTNYNIFVKTWDGQFWQNLGNTLDKVVSNNATEPSIAIGSDGLPVVAWQENGGASGIYPPDQATDIIVKKWNGFSWVQLGTALDVDPNEIALVPVIAIDKQNRPVVVWQQTSPFTYTTYAKRWNGVSWDQLGGALDRNINNSAGSPSIVMNSLGNPVVSFNEFVGTQHNVYVKRWVPSTASWANVGGILDVSSSRDAIISSIGLTSTNKPIVAWQECTDTTWPCSSNANVYVKQLQ
jgi:hypothetical protein